MQMNYGPRTLFRETAADDVKRFAIVEVGDDMYRIAEKWLREENADTWSKYWITADSLQSRIEAGECEQEGALNEAQFRDLLDAAGLNADRIDAAP